MHLYCHNSSQSFTFVKYFTSQGYIERIYHDTIDYNILYFIFLKYRRGTHNFSNIIETVLENKNQSVL